MTDGPEKEAPLPTEKQLVDFINNQPGPVGKREIARAFRLKGQQRMQLRRLIKDLEKSGQIDLGYKRRLVPKGRLPEVCIIEVSALDSDGELHAKQVASAQRTVDATIDILLKPSRRRGITAKIGDRVLARLRRIDEKNYEGDIIRILAPDAKKILGLLEAATGGALLRPTDRRSSKAFFIPENALKGARPGQLVQASPMPGRDARSACASVNKIIGKLSDPKAFSLIAIHARGIPHEFSDAVKKEVENIIPPAPDKRTDLRDIPLVTIDGADARDFDDAVFAEADKNSDNPHGWHLLVAIADVAHYVKPATALDRSALERGNSVYFPDRVVPMLPESLSNDLCSLRPHEDRACLAVHMWIDQNGRLKKHKFVRGLMRSVARLTYEQVQKALDGHPDEQTAELITPVLKPLQGAYRALEKARLNRGTLDLEIAERQIILDRNDHIKDIRPRARLESHKLIEEFMITANVAAAEALEAKGMAALYRIHEPPSMDKLEALRESLAGMGFNLARGVVLKPHHFTGILKKATAKGQQQIVSSIILRAQSQARYAPDNESHFGLALQKYCHFTSPIRRYADLLVHRALIRAYDLGTDGLSNDIIDIFGEIGDAISTTERRAAAAEREVVDRYTTAFLAEQTGARFSARINGVTRFGLFVSLDETGADGLVPVKTLPCDRYFHDEIAHALIGENNRLIFTLGDHIDVKLSEANILTGSMVFEFLDGGKIYKKKLKPSGRNRKKVRNSGKMRYKKGRNRR